MKLTRKRIERTTSLELNPRRIMERAYAQLADERAHAYRSGVMISQIYHSVFCKGEKK